MRPSVGRVVHYVSYQGEGCLAALVTHVYEDPDPADPATVLLGVTRRIGEVDLCAVSRNEISFRHVVPQNEPAKPPGTWHWPERVPE